MVAVVNGLLREMKSKKKKSFNTGISKDIGGLCESDLSDDLWVHTVIYWIPL